jgi:hypothetical protein
LELSNIEAKTAEAKMKQGVYLQGLLLCPFVLLLVMFGNE